MATNEKTEYRKYGRRKAGTWGKPHKGSRKAANRATRVKENRIARLAFKFEGDHAYV